MCLVSAGENTTTSSSSSMQHWTKILGRNLHGGNIHSLNTIHGSVLWFMVHYVLPQRYLFAAIGNGFRLYDVLAHEGNVTAFCDVPSCIATFLFTFRWTWAPQATGVPFQCSQKDNHLLGVLGRQVQWYCMLHKWRVGGGHSPFLANLKSLIPSTHHLFQMPCTLYSTLD